MVGVSMTTQLYSCRADENLNCPNVMCKSTGELGYKFLRQLRTQMQNILQLKYLSVKGGRCAFWKLHQKTQKQAP